MWHSTAATLLVVSLIIHSGDAVSRFAATRAALNQAGEDRRAAAIVQRAASVVEVASDASVSASSFLWEQERAAMRRLTAKMSGSERNASQAVSRLPSANVTLDQVVPATPDQAPLAHVSAMPVANVSAVEIATMVASSDAPDNASSVEGAAPTEPPASEDLLADIDKNVLAALTNASSAPTNASKLSELRPNDGAPESASVDLPLGPAESNATDASLDGELGRLVGDLHSRINNGLVPAAANAEAKSAEYTRSLEELRDSIVSFKGGIQHFEERAKEKHRAVMRRVQQALDTQRSASVAAPNSTSPATVPALNVTSAQSESTASPDSPSQ